MMDPMIMAAIVWLGAAPFVWLMIRYVQGRGWLQSWFEDCDDQDLLEAAFKIATMWPAYVVVSPLVLAVRVLAYLDPCDKGREHRRLIESGERIARQDGSVSFPEGGSE